MIYGASGSVGVFAVQLAKYFGAHVTAVCSTSNLALATSLGADKVLDYTRQDFSKAGRVYDVVFDAVGKSGFSRSLKALRKGGCYVRVGSGGTLSILGSMLRELWTSRLAAVNIISGVTVGTPTNQLLLKSKHWPRRRATKRKRNIGGRGPSAQPVWGVVRDFTRGRVRCAREFLKELIEAGKLRTVIDRRYSMNDIAEAHRFAEAGHKQGHVVASTGRDAAPPDERGTSADLGRAHSRFGASCAISREGESVVRASSLVVLLQ